MEKVKKNKKTFIFVIIFVVLGILSISSYFVLKQEFKIRSFKEEITINYKSNFKPNPGKVCYGNLLECSKVKKVIKNDVDTTKLGKYNVLYTFKYNGRIKTKRQTIIVKDIEAPKINIEYKNDNKKINVCTNGTTEDIVVTATDNYNEDVTDKINQELVENKLIIKVSDSFKNEATKTLDVIVKDITGPVIKINGLAEKNLLVGQSYTDEGATATDFCDGTVEVKSENNIDTKKSGTYYVTYTATDTSGNTSNLKRTVHVNDLPKNGDKIIYLTFDDGPSAYTSRLLDVLKKYNVKATFFVTGSGSDEIIKRAYDEGHTIGLHTNTHDYSYVYSSVDNYFKDLYTVRDRVKRITGFDSTIIRFPGGSSNTVSCSYDGGIKIMSILTKEVEKRGFHYFDWNASSGDAGSTTSTDQVYLNIVNRLYSDYTITLQHDTKEFSINAVEKIINYGLNNGYKFKPLDESSPGAHHGVNN